ncbi:MAG: TolC family outer membrane protein [Desulfobacterales bacterium]
MKKVIRCVFVGMVLWGGLFWGCGDIQAETLKEAVALVLQTNPEIEAQAYNRLAVTQEIIAAKSGYYPRLDFFQSVGVGDEQFPDYRRSWPTETIISLRQNLFRGFMDYHEVQRQENRMISSAYRLQEIAENTALEGARVYLNVLRQMELDELAELNLANHQRIYDQIKLRTESGVDRRADLDQVLGRLALARSNTVATQANLIDANTDYLSVIGHLPENLQFPEPVVEMIPENLKKAQAIALDEYPLVLSAAADVSARKAQHKVAKGLYSPTFDAAVEYHWTDDLEYFDDNREEFVASLLINFNLFNGFYKPAKVAEAAYLIREAQEIKNNTQRQVTESVRLSWMAYIAAKDKLKHMENYVAATQLTREAFAKQWTIGQRTMFDVLDIEAELIDAKRQLVETRYDHVFAQYRVLNAMGKLVPAFGLERPGEGIVTASMDTP